MNETEIRERILHALRRIAPEADLAALDSARDLRAQLDLDSMDFLELMAAVAAATGVGIPERDYGKVASLDACVAYVTARAQRAAAG